MFKLELLLLHVYYCTYILYAQVSEIIKRIFSARKASIILGYWKMLNTEYTIAEQKSKNIIIMDGLPFKMTDKKIIADYT